MEELSFEILYVDDGGSGSTLELIDAIANENPQVKYISFSRNFGCEWNSCWFLSMRLVMQLW